MLWRVLDRSRSLLLGWGLACLATFALLAFAVTEGWGPLADVGARGGGPDVPYVEAGTRAYDLLRWIELTFGTTGMTVLTIATGLVMLLRGHRRAAVVALVVPGLTALATTWLKVWIGRERPDWQNPEALLESNAFPSGHASSVAALGGVVCVLVLMLVRRATVRRLVYAAVGLVVVGVCLDRVLLGRHFPSDVVGGVLLGAGILLVVLVAAWGVREGLVTGAGRHRFGWPELRAALWEAKWELSIPFAVLGVLFSGFTTLVETAAFTALYAAVIQGLIHRDFSLGRGLHKAFSECVVLVGGVLVILGVAVGFTAYLNDANVPGLIVEWVDAHVGSRLMFLLGLNLFLLLVGCLMDIFSAIFVVVPLIVPVAAQFGINPLHLGIIFIANLELGFLTPPVGLNLFLASYRFDRPLMEVYRATLPLLAILGFGVLVITYVPWLTLGLLEWLGRG